MKINQHDVKRYLQLARRFWDSNFRTESGTVVLTFTAISYTIAMIKQNLMLNYLCNRIEPETDVTTIAIPLELLQDCVSGQGTIHLELVDQNGCHRIQATWQDGPVPKSQIYDLAPVPSDHLIPDLAWHTVDERLLQSMARTAEIADNVSLRYDLSCIELDGRYGSVTATDGKQLLRYEGFSFPWPTQTLLVRRNKIMQNKDWLSSSGVDVAQLENDLFISAGAWTIRIPVERDVRYPNLLVVMPHERDASNCIQLHHGDSSVLQACIGKLPGADTEEMPLVLDLNGHVVVYGKSTRDGQPGVSLSLVRSLHTGPDHRTWHNRKYLKRAISLGAKTLYLFSDWLVAIGQGEGFRYLWMPLPTQNTELDMTGSVQIKSAIVA